MPVLLFVVSTIVPSTHWMIVIAFVVGAFFSALAGNMGMKIATKTNVRNDSCMGRASRAPRAQWTT